jgi:hypothetical protein
MKNIRSSIQIAVRHPSSGSQLLAKTISDAFMEATWISRDLKIRFCIIYMKMIIGCELEQTIDDKLLEKVTRKSLPFGIRLLKRYPETGIFVLVKLIINELNQKQNFTLEQLVEFHSELLSHFFPDI